MTARAGGERPEPQAHEKCTSEKWGIRCWLVKGHSGAHVARGCSWGVSMADEEPEPQPHEGERRTSSTPWVWVEVVCQGCAVRGPGQHVRAGTSHLRRDVADLTREARKKWHLDADGEWWCRTCKPGPAP